MLRCYVAIAHHFVTALTGPVLVWSFILTFLLSLPVVVDLPAVPLHNMLLPLQRCANVALLG